MDPNSNLKPQMVSLLVRAAVVGAMTYYGVKMVVNLMDPTNSQKKKAKNKAIEILNRLGIGSVGDDLNEYESIIANDLLNPKDIDVTFSDVAGLDNVIEELYLQVILPLSRPEYFVSNLRQPPRGVLFHGPPGCGKTMLAKAIAKEANVRFMNLSVSALTDKWYGESQKLAQAVFTLALKIQPCIIFIDEIDSFLRSRDSHDHEATAMMKAQFMTLWEGILSSKKCQIVLIGATNRPQDVDAAVLRRMPCMFQIDLPSEDERHEILKLILANEKLSPNVNLSEIAKGTDGYSGSDLKDLCRRAAMTSLKELNERIIKSSGYQLPRNRNRGRGDNNKDKSPSTSIPLGGQSLNNDAGNAFTGQPMGFRHMSDQEDRSINLDPSRSTAVSSLPELRDITMEDFLHSIKSIDSSRNGIKPKKSKIPLD